MSLAEKVYRRTQNETANMGVTPSNGGNIPRYSLAKELASWSLSEVRRTLTQLVHRVQWFFVQRQWRSYRCQEQRSEAESWPSQRGILKVTARGRFSVFYVRLATGPAEGRANLLGQRWLRQSHQQ